MKLGIMQPYFFPYLGHFDLISRVDRWIVFDTTQYIRHGWMNRNRILHPTEGWQYIIVPLVKHAREASVREVEAKAPGEWVPRILGQIQHYKRRAPHFASTFQLVRECLDTDERSLTRLNVRILERTCAHLGLPFQHSIFSEMNLDIGIVDDAGDWALRIGAAVGATEYLNPPSGAELFDPAKFTAQGIRLRIQEPFEFSYECPGYQFETNLSVIDALMWNGPDKLKAFLDSRRAALANQ